MPLKPAPQSKTGKQEKIHTKAQGRPGTVKGPASNSFHAALLREIFKKDFPLSEQNALLLASILHTCTIILREPILRDAPGSLKIEGLTQRGAMEAVGSLWPVGNSKRHYTHWYTIWNTTWGGYRHLEKLTTAEQKTWNAYIQAMEKHPWVKKIIPDL